jgi:hypothetical protein
MSARLWLRNLIPYFLGLVNQNVFQLSKAVAISGTLLVGLGWGCDNLV